MKRQVKIMKTTSNEEELKDELNSTDNKKYTDNNRLCT